jgi:hypothetical protein
MQTRLQSYSKSTSNDPSPRSFRELSGVISPGALLINVVLRRTRDLRSSYELLPQPDLSPPSLLLPSLDKIALTAASNS